LRFWWSFSLFDGAKLIGARESRFKKQYESKVEKSSVNQS
jgi:hypothetical protein